MPGNRFSGGTAGTTLTQGSGGNTGGTSGDFFNFLSLGTSMTYQPVPWPGGSMGARLVGGGYMRWDVTGFGTATRVVARTPIYITAHATGDWNVIQYRTAANASVGDAIVIGTGGNAGKIALRPAFSYMAASLSTFAMSLNTLYWLEVAASPGTTTSNGRMEYRLTDDAGTVLASYDTGATVNAGTAPGIQVRFTGGPAGSTVYFDDVRFEAVSSGWIGPFSTSASIAAVTATATGLVRPPGVEGGVAVIGGGPATANVQVRTPVVTGASAPVSATAPFTLTLGAAASGMAYGGTVSRTAPFTMALTAAALRVERELASAPFALALAGAAAGSGSGGVSSRTAAFALSLGASASGSGSGGTATRTAPFGLALSATADGNAAGGVASRTAPFTLTLSGTAVRVERELATAPFALALAPAAAAQAAGGAVVRTAPFALNLGATAARVEREVTRALFSVALAASASATGSGGTVPAAAPFALQLTATAHAVNPGQARNATITGRLQPRPWKGALL